MSHGNHVYDERYFEELGASSVSKRLRARYWVKRLLPEGGGLVLNLGCGPNALPVPNHGQSSVVSVDLSEWALSELGTGMRVCADAGSLPFRTHSFDGVMAFDVLEHLSNPASALAQLHASLRGCGRLVITVPNAAGASARLARRMPGRHVWVAHSDRTHVSLLLREDWLRAVRLAGFRIVRVGTDTPWAAPYGRRMRRTQMLVARAASVAASAWTAALPWSLGENLVISAVRRPASK